MRERFAPLLTLILMVTTAQANVFGSNDRVPVQQANGVLAAIGKLVSSTRNLCTASLVGKDLIITAAHCVAGESTQFSNKTYRFTLPNGVTSAAYPIASGTRNYAGSSQRENDWALMRLDQALGSQYGYFSNHMGDNLEKDLKRRLSISGYGEVGRNGHLTHQDSCRVRETFGEKQILYHDCDAGRGDSGAPIYYCSSEGYCYLVGIHVSAVQHNSDRALYVDRFSMNSPNLAASVKMFSRAIGEAR